MSKFLEDYGDWKLCVIIIVWWLVDFLGDEMVKDKGFSCCYIVVCDL